MAENKIIEAMRKAIEMELRTKANEEIEKAMRRMENQLQHEKDIVIECAKGKCSQIIGNNKRNINDLKNKYGLRTVKVIENDKLVQFDIIIRQQEEAKCV